MVKPKRSVLKSNSTSVVIKSSLVASKLAVEATKPAALIIEPAAAVPAYIMDTRSVVVPRLPMVAPESKKAKSGLVIVAPDLVKAADVLNATSFRVNVNDALQLESQDALAAISQQKEASAPKVKCPQKPMESKKSCFAQKEIGALPIYKVCISSQFFGDVTDCILNRALV